MDSLYIIFSLLFYRAGVFVLVFSNARLVHHYFFFFLCQGSHHRIVVVSGSSIMIFSACHYLISFLASPSDSVMK